MSTAPADPDAHTPRGRQTNIDAAHRTGRDLSRRRLLRAFIALVLLGVLAVVAYVVIQVNDRLSVYWVFWAVEYDRCGPHITAPICSAGTQQFVRWSPIVGSVIALTVGFVGSIWFIMRDKRPYRWIGAAWGLFVIAVLIGYLPVIGH